MKHLHLDIAEMGTVDDAVLKAVAILLEDQSQLVELYLDLYDNVLVTDEGLNALSNSLQELSALHTFFIELSGYPLEAMKPGAADRRWTRTTIR